MLYFVLVQAGLKLFMTFLSFTVTVCKVAGFDLEQRRDFKKLFGHIGDTIILGRRSHSPILIEFLPGHSHWGLVEHRVHRIQRLRIRIWFTALKD